MAVKALALLLAMLVFPHLAVGQDDWQRWNEPQPDAPYIFNVPHFSFSAGTFTERFEGLGEVFDEPAYGAGLGWDVVFHGHHAATIDSESLVTESGRFAGVADSRISTWRLSAGYLWSSWNRALPPSRLEGISRRVRFAGGLSLLYRNSVLDVEDGDAEIDVHTVGPEGRLDIEAGLRHIASLFASGRVAGGYTRARARNSASTEDSLDTEGLEVRAEAGILSQPVWNFEIRAGYRYIYYRIYDRPGGADGISEIQLGFIEFRFPF